MAVQAQFGGLLLQQFVAEEQMRPLLLSAAATPGADGGYCAAQSELTCNNGGVPSRKRGREDGDELLHYAAFLPLPAMMRPHSVSVTPAPSTSGRPAEAPAPAPASAEQDALASELLWRRHDAEVDALVRAECDRLRAGLLEAARKRQRQALVHAAAAVSSSAFLARRAREAKAKLEAARRRAVELEERVRLAAAEAQAWCGVARGNEAVAAGLRATLDAVILRAAVGATAQLAGSCAEEGFGESGCPDDAESCCFVEAGKDAMTVSASTAAKWACRSCGHGEASVLVLPCRHMCLCKACEPRTDACPVCAGAKNAAIHIAPN